MIATRTLSITQLYEDHIDKLRLSWVAAVGVERLVELRDMEIYGPDVVGHLNLIYSHRVQVIGKAEQRWLEQVGEERWLRQLSDLMVAKPPALIVADDLEPPPGVREICEKTQTPLFSSPKDCSAVIDLLHLYLARDLTFGETHPDADEFLQVRRLPFDTLLARCLSGEIEDNAAWREARVAQETVPEADLVAKVLEILAAQAEDRAQAVRNA